MKRDLARRNGIPLTNLVHAFRVRMPVVGCGRGRQRRGRLPGWRRKVRDGVDSPEWEHGSELGYVST